MRNTVTLQKDGRLTIPKFACDTLGLSIGDTVDVTVSQDGNIQVRKMQKNIEKN